MSSIPMLNISSMEYGKKEEEEEKKEREEKENEKETRRLFNGKEQIELREWNGKIVKLSQEDIEHLYSICLDRPSFQSKGKEEKKRTTKRKKRMGAIDHQQRERSSLISIAPSLNGPDEYLLTPKNVIGVVDLPSKVLIIKPKISVSNILFLLCFTWEPLEWKSNLNLFSPMNDEKIEALTQAITQTFTQKINKTFKKSVCQGYQCIDDTLNHVRGQIMWSRQINKGMGRMFPLEVTFEEFTEDVVENRLIKAACFLLSKTKNLSPQLRKSLRSIESKLDNVSHVQFDPFNLPEVNYHHGINDHYRPAIEISKFIIKNLMWTIQHGSFDAPIFLLYMPKVFEDFVVNSLRETKALQELGVSHKNFIQNKDFHLDEDKRYTIKPDFTFWDGLDCLFVGDCKYKRLRKGVDSNSQLSEFEEDEGNKSIGQDIYQMIAYMSALKLPSCFLIYADDSKQNNQETPNVYSNIVIKNTSEFTIKRRAINLSSNPSFVLKQIEAIASEIAFDCKEIRIQVERRKEEPKGNCSINVLNEN
eukprot:TRINITY_DN477_c0_g1_i1.p1 TRINITY_DN477_c0_g1~~TRINITY_DN477_c0_g1_i1.p1  ORF type:complete len:532 (+),score=144.14 TRINITY_DN477_c0_g1_i1:136-1731(+)